VTLKTKLWASSATLFFTALFMGAVYFLHPSSSAWGWKVIAIASGESLIFLGAMSAFIGKSVAAFFAAAIGGVLVRGALLIGAGWFFAMRGLPLAAPLLSLVFLFLFFNVMQTAFLIFQNEL